MWTIGQVMGIYDKVNHKMDCPKCGKEVTDFQTKDTNGWFETIEYWQCDNFYSSCDYCTTWIEFTLQRDRVNIPLDAYEMKVELSELKESQVTRNEAGKITSICGKG